VVDGAVRDLEEMIEHALVVFARHLTPLTGRSRLASPPSTSPSAAGERACDRATWWSATGQAWCVLRPSAPSRWPNWPSATPDDEAAAAELRKWLTFSAAMAKFERI